MSNDEFQAWVQGYILLAQDKPLNEQQIFIIKNHANLVESVDCPLTLDNQMLINNLNVGVKLGHYIKRGQENV